MSSSALHDIEARAADWIAERDRAGADWPPERRQAFEDWLAGSTAHRVAYLRLDQAWMRADRLGALHAPGPAARTAAPSRFAWLARPRMLGAGAGLTLALLATVLVSGHGSVPAPQHYATAVGGREAVALADGSRLTLNTATALRAAVTGEHREVWLERGEAFFDIAHDPRRPFVVHAGRQTVTVLGTKFSLFREGEHLRVVVLEGKVKVQAPRSRPAVLTREQAAVADASSVLVTRKTGRQLDASLSWMQGKLVFDQVTLAEAARQFNRYGRKQLVIGDEAAARIGIGGVFDANNVEAFARLLHAGFGLEVETRGDEIVVSSPSS